MSINRPFEILSKFLSLDNHNKIATTIGVTGALTAATGTAVLILGGFTHDVAAQTSGFVMLGLGAAAIPGALMMVTPTP